MKYDAFRQHVGAGVVKLETRKLYIYVNFHKGKKIQRRLTLERFHPIRRTSSGVVITLEEVLLTGFDKTDAPTN